jgi:hypothetical protein
MTRKGFRVRTALVTVALCVVVAEVFLAAAYWRKTGEIIWLRPIKQESGNVAVTAPTLGMLDPYLGYTNRTGTPYAKWNGWREAGYQSPPDWVSWRVNNYGFFQDKDYPVQTTPRRDFVVGIFGSSTAEGLALHGRETIVKYLQSNPALRERNIIILNFGIGGYKQPQQLLTLSYFVALGQHFDLIINMDGSTNAYIGWDNVARYQVDPSMPAARFVYGLENWLAGAGANGATDSTRARIAALNALLDRTRSAALFYLLTTIRDQLERKRVEVVTDEEKILPGRQYIIRMQQAKQPEFSQNVDRIADVWARSSLEMAGIADRIGATYVHLLEPNQWLEQKPLSSEEKKLLAKASEPMAEIVPPMYRAMHRVSEELRKQVNFLDGTEAFEGHQETIYVDGCCHFGLTGYRLLVDNVLGPWLQTFIPTGADKDKKTQ